MPVYFHETIDPTPEPGKQEEYLAEIGSVAKRLAGLGPKAPMRCVANWVTVWATGRWPQVIGLWEIPSWESFAGHFDEGIARLLLDAPQHYYQYRLGGFDRLLLPAPYTPTYDDIVRRGVRAPVLLQEHIGVQPDTAAEYLEALGKAGTAMGEADGIWLVAGYEVALRDGGEVLALWGLDDFGVFARLQQDPEASPGLAAWRRDARDMQTSYIATLMSPAAWSALR